MNKLAFFLILIVHTGILFGQTKVTITGSVADKATGETLVGANVFSLSDMTIGAVTNANGEFTLQVSQSDNTQTLVFSFMGYEEKSMNLSFSKNQVLDIRLSMKTANIEEAVVTAKRIIAEEFTVKEMKQLEIYVSPMAKADPLLAVNAMPSATTTDESANISLRGSSPAETGIFFNNVPIYDPVRFSQINGVGTFSIFNTAIVDRMHVFPGNPPLEFGNTTAGLISIQSSEKLIKRPKTDLVASLASFGALHSRPIGTKSSFTIFTNYQPSEIFIATNKESFKDLKRFNTFDIGLNYLYKINKNSHLKIFNYANYESYKFKDKHPSFVGYFDQKKRRNFTVLDFSKFSDKYEFSVNSGFSYSKATYSFGNLDVDAKNRDIYFALNYQRFWGKFSSKAGFTVDSRKTSMKGSVPIFYYAKNDNHPSFMLDTAYYVDVPEFYSYSKYSLTDNCVLGFGLRKNVPVNGQKSYLSAQFNLNYIFNSYNSATFSLGKYNKYCVPNGEEREVYFISSKQISVDYKYKKSFVEIKPAIFYKKSQIKDDDVDILGAEFYTKFKVGKNIETELSYTYIDAQIEKEELEYPSNYDMDYFVRASLKYKLPANWEISAIGVYRQGVYYQDVTSTTYEPYVSAYQPRYESREQMGRLPSYSIIDLSITKLWVVGKNTSIIGFASIGNVLNTENVRRVNYSEDYSRSFNDLFTQRTAYFGVSVQF